MMDSSAAWNGQDPTMSLASQDDFQQFLDLGNSLGDINFEFGELSGQQDTQMMHQDRGDIMDMRMDTGRGAMGQHDTIMQENIPMTSAQNHHSIPGTPLAHEHHSNSSLSEIDAQIQYLLQQRQNQHRQLQEEEQRNYYARNRAIPPTPNSVELHCGNSQQFYPHSDPQQQAMYERYQIHAKEQEMAFTPLVSPAVTPLETQFNQYTVPGAYFSPLSSPALHAQNEQSSVYEQMHSGTTNSPIEMNFDTHSAPASSVILSKTSSRKSLQKPRSTRATVRQSPLVKPQRKRKGTNMTVPPPTLGDIIEPPSFQIPRSQAASSSNASTVDSENGSISPETLSDMAPPPVPKPRSATMSPFITAQKEAEKVQPFPLGSPATPASLMRITKSPSSSQAPANHDADLDDQAMGDFALPEPATDLGRPQPSRLDTQSDGQTTPTLSSTAAKHPSFQPLPSPVLTQPRMTASASQSPQIAPSNDGPIRKTPLLAGRGSKKRASVSSVQVSPALRPRISPSIKPLLPGSGSASDDTASLLLASKSNYQNILEGTHLPGVSYPSELSTNLTSKRTSHKIAEQGRRNRINSALQEIATLLPRGSGKDSGCEKSGDSVENGDGKGAGSAAQSANSKASTVELAIEYIKQLQNEVAEANKRAEEAEKLLEQKA